MLCYVHISSIFPCLTSIKNFIYISYSLLTFHFIMAEKNVLMTIAFKFRNENNCLKLDSSFFPIIVREGRQGNCNMRLKHIVIWGKWLLWCSPKWSFFSLLPLPEGKTILWVNCRGSEALIYGQKEKRNTTENG